MTTAIPVEVRATGDEWEVAHPSLDRQPTRDTFDSAHEVAVTLASELSTTIEIAHPRNVNLRRLSA